MMMRVELKISCSGLVGSKAPESANPIVKVQRKNKTGNLFEIGKTEKLISDDNPTFNQAFEIQYRFEDPQTLQFNVYDVINDMDNEVENDTEKDNQNDISLGEATLSLGQIIAKKEITEKLSKQALMCSKPSTITVSAKALGNVDELEFTIHGSGLDKKDFLGKLNPYLQLRRKKEEINEVIYQTEMIKDTRKPQWASFSVPVDNLCEGDFNPPVLFQVYDHDNNNSHSLIGECDVELSQLLENADQSGLHLINKKKKMKKKDYKNSGKLSVLQCKVVKKFSFLDYVLAGCKIQFACGIDFTGSNGDPRQPSSLHYMGRVNPNEYVQTMLAVGKVLQDYSSETLFPAFGFGAKVPPSNEVSHDFPLNLDVENPCCKGIEAMLFAYTDAVKKVKLWGPTNLAPIINKVAEMAKKSQQSIPGSNYLILLLVIDGVVTDCEQTREAIVKSSQLPMSVIIVGVGNADFSAMAFLEKQLPGSGGKTAIRTNTKFELFRNFKMMPEASFAQKVLGEIPAQVEEYFFMMKTLPISGNAQREE